MQQIDSTKKMADEDEVMKSRMEAAAPTYDRYMKLMTLWRERTLRERTVRAAGVKAGDCVLEVGCGTGSLTLEASRQIGPAGKAFGIDVIPLMIELSRQKASKLGSDVTFQVGNMDNIPFPENQFDVVMGSFMIFHMSEDKRRKGIAEISRVLKPAGRIFFLDSALPPQPFRRLILEKILGFKLERDLSELQPLLEANGFGNVEMGTFDFNILGFAILGFIRGVTFK
jgi:ubiquinone/menaquinone biosynthesis C-methylase UbiE